MNGSGPSAEAPAHQEAPPVPPKPRRTVWGWFAAHWARIIAHIVLLIICVMWLAPLLGLVVTSFRLPTEAASGGWWLAFTDPGFNVNAYGEALARKDMLSASVNSLIVALPVTVLVVAIAAPAAWAFTRLRFRGDSILFVLIALMLLTPRQLSLEPLLVLFTSWGLNGTYASLWIYMVAFELPLAIVILRGAFSTIPSPLMEAASIDGARELSIFTRIAVPLTMPAIGTVFVMTFLNSWNELLAPLIFLPGDKKTVTVALTQLVAALDLSPTVVAAGAIIAVIPPVLLFIFLQRYFVAGIAGGAVKE